MLNQSLIDTVACVSSLLTELINRMDMVATSGMWLDVFCNVWLSTYVMWSTISSSAYNLVFLTLERYVAIVNPMKYDREKVMRRLPIVIVLAWISG